jgi:hypothetical protein
MKVITCVVNNPIFIEIQYKTLKKYLKNDFEYIVFNDAKPFPDITNGNNVNLKTDIEDLCKRLNIKCINIPNDTYYHRSIQCTSTRTAMGMNFMLKYQIANPDQYLILDSDMFLIDYLDVNERYKGYKTAFNLRKRFLNNKIYRYMWVGIVYMDMRKIDDIYYLDWGLNYGVTDCGGMSEEWMKRQIKDDENIPSVYEIEFNRFDKYHTSNIYFMKTYRGHNWRINEIPKNLERKNKFIEFLKEDKRNYGELIFSEIYDDIFYHYHAGCNWRGEGLEYHKYLSNKLNEVIIDVDDN